MKKTISFFILLIAIIASFLLSGCVSQKDKYIHYADNFIYIIQRASCNKKVKIVKIELPTKVFNSFQNNAYHFSNFSDIFLEKKGEIFAFTWKDKFYILKISKKGFFILDESNKVVLKKDLNLQFPKGFAERSVSIADSNGILRVFFPVKQESFYISVINIDMKEKKLITEDKVCPFIFRKKSKKDFFIVSDRKGEQVAFLNYNGKTYVLTCYDFINKRKKYDIEFARTCVFKEDDFYYILEKKGKYILTIYNGKKLLELKDKVTKIYINEDGKVILFETINNFLKKVKLYKKEKDFLKFFAEIQAASNIIVDKNRVIYLNKYKIPVLFDLKLNKKIFLPYQPEHLLSCANNYIDMALLNKSESDLYLAEALSCLSVAEEVYRKVKNIEKLWQIELLKIEVYENLLDRESAINEISSALKLYKLLEKNMQDELRIEYEDLLFKKAYYLTQIFYEKKNEIYLKKAFEAYIDSAVSSEKDTAFLSLLRADYILTCQKEVKFSKDFVEKVIKMLNIDVEDITPLFLRLQYAVLKKAMSAVSGIKKYDVMLKLARRFIEFGKVKKAKTYIQMVTDKAKDRFILKKAKRLLKECK